MNEYDPDNDPRYVPDPDVFLLDREIVEVTDRLESNAVHIARFEQILALFESPGWANFIQIVAAEADQLDMHLTRATDQSNWKYLRGQRVWCDFILQMPQTIEKSLRSLRVKQNELNAQVEGLREQNEGGS